MPSYAERLADAQAYQKACKIKPDDDRQKFKRYSRVKISEECATFYGGHEAIVAYTYGQKFGGESFDSYSLIPLDEHGHGCNHCSWYDESKLELVDENFEANRLILEAYEYPVDKRQLFPRGTVVDIHNHRVHKRGVVWASYAQQYRGNDFSSYTLLILDAENKVIDEVSWFKESELTKAEGYEEGFGLALVREQPSDK